MKKIYIPILLLFCFHRGAAQNWLKDMYDPQVNFYTVQREFNDWWAVNGPTIMAADTTEGDHEHGEAWKIYKRWEENVAPIMEANQGVRLGAFNQAEADYYARHRGQSAQRSSANWTYIGTPSSFNDNTSSGDSSTGRINCVRFDPVNRSVIYCGAPSGGLWKSLDFGHTWQLLNTDNLAQIGVSDIAINPLNPNTIYIATGDIANAATFSIGILKSTDGGANWDTTGLRWTVSQGRLIARLLMSPLDTNTLIAATNAGSLKSTDGGYTWTTNATVGSLTGMEFNPTNPNTIYACGTQLFKSVDGAVSWQHLTTGLPSTGLSGGFAVGLTPADTSCVYILASSAYTGTPYQTFQGIYRSLDGGGSFTRQSANPDPTSTGTQGQYDLNVAVSPTNRDQLVMAAVENAYSNDGGVTWTSPSTDSHVDHHDLRFLPGSSDTLFSADDGGLFMSTDRGHTWAGRNDGMHIGQIYSVCSSAQTKYFYLTGRQDEGLLRQDSSALKIAVAGDGLECLIDPTNQDNMLAELQNGLIIFSHDGGNTGAILTFNFNSGVNGPGAWYTPFAWGAHSNQTIYVAKDSIYESIDGGNSWNALNSPALSRGQYYIMMAIAPSNDQYIYAGTNNKLYRSNDGGSTFADITASLHTPFYSIAVSPDNPEEVWVGTSTSHIYKSTTAGSAWTDFSTGLPVGSSFYPKTIVAVKNSPDALYTGLYYAGGVYYRDSTMSQWMPYSNGLPNVSVSQLEVDYCAGKIRAATYGRDLWESDPYQPIAVTPIAQANYDLVAFSQCSDTFQFLDNSSYTPTAWQWYFPGGQPAASTAQNPVVTYPANGNYTATFIASNAAGADTTHYSVYTSPCTGITSPSANSAIQIIPNPSNGTFVISLTNDARGNIDFTVIDNVGQSVYQFSAVKNADLLAHEFSLSGISAGVYFVRITSGGTSSTQKLVISN